MCVQMYGRGIKVWMGVKVEVSYGSVMMPTVSSGNRASVVVQASKWTELILSVCRKGMAA